MSSQSPDNFQEIGAYIPMIFLNPKKWFNFATTKG